MPDQGTPYWWRYFVQGRTQPQDKKKPPIPTGESSEARKKRSKMSFDEWLKKSAEVLEDQGNIHR